MLFIFYFFDHGGKEAEEYFRGGREPKVDILVVEYNLCAVLLFDK